MSAVVDIAHLRTWIGRTESVTDTVSPRLLAEFRATFGLTDEAVPLGLQWCLAPATLPPQELAEDGHGRRGGFQPPVPLPRRMWAGGTLTYLDQFQPGDTVTRRSTIADISQKDSLARTLVFVAVDHEFSTPRGVILRERHNVVYVEGSASGPPKAEPAPLPATHTITMSASPVLLFRYSALTFNGHRIHYDHDYARKAEGYPGVLVHGPLQATLLLQMAGRHRPSPRTFNYRAHAPLFDGTNFTINAAEVPEGLKVWTANGEGYIGVSGIATW